MKNLLLGIGRIGRLKYFLYTSITFIVQTTTMYLTIYNNDSSVLPLADSEQVISYFFSNISIVAALMTILCLYLNTVLTVQRLHDIDKAGWIAIFNFIWPISTILYIVLLMVKGTAGPNQYDLDNDYVIQKI